MKYNLSKIMLKAWKIYRKTKDIHLFGCSLIWGSRGDGAEYKASFFGKSQVEAI